MEDLQPLSHWFQVSFEDTHINLDVEPPGGERWNARIEWSSINRVCFKAGSFLSADEIYIFTDERPESYLIPTEANGGGELWREILRKGLFDAETSIKAMQTTDELFCWPPVD